MINVELNVVGGKHAGQKIPLDRKKFLIGREQDCQLRPNSELVSRHHCIFTVDEYSVRVRDLGSTNGTIVNGERIRKETVLQQGDHVVVGSLEFNILIHEGGAAGSVKSVDSSDTVVSSADTLNEMLPIQPGSVPAPATSPPSQSLTPMEMPSVSPQQAQSSGDTTVIGQPILLPGQTPYQPMMQPMGYPMYGGYPYPGMPMPGYPGQPMMAPYPGVPVAEQTPAPKASGVPDVSLPDPSTTGARPDPPKPAAAEGTEKAKSEASNQSADAIIKSFMNRKPGK
ncbi:MAG: FHA domain-containing protein [Planctomycetaceae bacterium]